MSYFQQPFRPEDISIMASNMNEPNLDEADNESSGGSNTRSSGTEPGDDLDVDEGASLSVAEAPTNLVIPTVVVPVGVVHPVIALGLASPDVGVPAVESLSPASEPEENVAEAMATLNPDSDYVPSTNDDEKGELQKYMENLAEDTTEDGPLLNEAEVFPFIFMLCHSEFAEWDIANKQPYLDYESKALKDKKPRDYKALKISKKLLVKELTRRDASSGKNSRNKGIKKLLEELSKEAVALNDIRDAIYLSYREREMRAVIEGFLVKVQNTEKKTKTPPTTKADRMHVILMFEDFVIVDAYRQTQIPLTRTELDGRNSEEHQQHTFEGLAIAKFNDASWVPVSQVIPNLHEDYATAVEYPLRAEYTMDADKLKSIFRWEKQKIKAVCDNYMRSGNGANNAAEMYQIGEGDNIHVDSTITAKFGHFDLDKAEQQGGDDRSNFNGRNPSDVLYWWHVLDHLDLITMVCVKLNQELGANCHTTPLSVSDVAVAAKRKLQASKETDEISKNLASLMEQVGNFGETIAENLALFATFGSQMKEENERQEAVDQDRLDESYARDLKREIREQTIKMLEAESTVVKNGYASVIAQMQEELAELAGKKQRSV